MLLAGLALFCSTTKADRPLTSETAGGPEATNVKSVKNYEYVFSTWKALRYDPPAAEPTIYCPPCICEGECVLPPQRVKSYYADWPGRPQFRSFAPPLPASPGLPSTVTDAAETHRRATIVPVSSTSVPEPNADAEAASVQTGEQEDSFVDKLKQKFMSGPDSPTTDDGDPREITKTFYTYGLSGYHPIAIPLIVSSGTSNSPITVLAYARSTHFSSFISSSLVADLNRTSEIRPTFDPPLYTPEKNMTNVLGYETKILGQISLDIVTGSRDRMLQDTNFTVFAEKEDIKEGWRPDLLVGIDFLNEIGGIKLTEEYSGDDRARAKDGLPVLVQRVFKPDNKEDCDGAEEEISKDEL